MAYLLLALINILLIFLLRTEKKYWLVPISIWILLITSFVFWRNYQQDKIDKLETAYWKSAENKIRGDQILWEEKNKEVALVQKYNMTCLNSIFLQSILTFSLQLIGLRKASHKRIYKWTTFVFAIVLLLNLFLELLLGMPTGVMLG